jgi:hypothetical protein
MNDAEHGLTVQLRTNGHLNGEWRYATPEEIKDAHPMMLLTDLTNGRRNERKHNEHPRWAQAVEH